MRQRAGVWIGAALSALIVAGCAQTVPGTAQREDANADSGRSYGYVDDSCGLLDDSTVKETLGADELARPYSGAVCQYVLSRGAAPALIDVTFSWFATGTLARERTLAERRGGVVTDIVVERRPAFTARRDVTGAACSATAAAGSGVVSWWVQYRGRDAGEPCVAAEKLLTATLRSDM
ncbi:hypothetical protein CRI77_08010 [Mycolicibacterium duvalii]|uniref:DUF3558 domain-containing protein n=1 Tax=Mycolicibacterium duvalii TaxID=39688 RepID=UPI000BEF0AEB|nr:DUF3558 domain-containing protein [Mycolicibacterium duvalii]MCV7367831.1 DUF3558 domain-containing protein [Mycolicibacterium duvalii]PEG42618.1 hypothetical protein CRI77_08010 [Mycolicibacterium duvalii]